MSAGTPAPAFTEPPPRYIRASYLAPGEAILRETRPTLLSWLPGPMFWLIVVGLLDLAAISAAWGGTGVPYLTGAFGHLTGTSIGGHTLLYYVALLLGIITLGLLLWLLVRYLHWISTAYAVTTNRIIVQRGLISRDFDEIPVIKVRAIEVHQSPWQRLLGYGTVRITSEGENPIANEAWYGLPKPWEFQKLADAAAQRYNVR